METILVTGGAGFLGSHLVDRLIQQGDRVVVIDNISTGFERNLYSSLCTEKCSLVKIDILNRALLKHIIDVNKVTTVYHFAANADIRNGINNLDVDLEQNVQGTCSVLWACKDSSVSTFVFASSAAVYGEPRIWETPTDERYPLIQTSVYGASKAAAEMYIQAYSEYFGIKSISFRLTSCLGERYSHGVVLDFVKKLRKNSKSLEILGDGNQLKSFLYVEDAIDAILDVTKNKFFTMNKKKYMFNLGHTCSITVKDLADIVCDEMKFSNVQYHFTGGRGGWVGDSPTVVLDVSRLQDMGWHPKTSIEEAIRKTVRFLSEV
jgi:UDP-glucose 4-epimerase